LYAPQTITNVLATSDSGTRIFCDPTGTDLWTVLKEAHAESPESLTLLVGPEGDLTGEEKELVRSSGFTFCALTPTVLRAHQAVSLITGIIRSVFK